MAFELIFVACLCLVFYCIFRRAIASVPRGVRMEVVEAPPSSSQSDYIQNSHPNMLKAAAETQSRVPIEVCNDDLVHGVN